MPSGNYAICISLVKEGLNCVAVFVNLGAKFTVAIKSVEAVGPVVVHCFNSSTVKIYGAVLMICEKECIPISNKVSKVIFFNVVKLCS